MGRRYFTHLVSFLLLGFTKTVASSWLVGCCYGYDSTVGRVDAALLTSGWCVRRCLLNGSEFAAWKKSNCICMKEKPTDLRECPFSYNDDDSQKQNELYRVFWTSGPELSNATLLLPAMPVDVGQQVALRATARVDGENGFGGKLALEFQWTGGQVSYVERRQVPTNRTTTLESVWLTSFPEEGNYQIFVRLLNGARTLSLKSWLTARPPIPGDLRLTLRTPATPNCVPTHLCHNRSSAILVLAGLPVLLEAVLVVSSTDQSDTNTFRWVVSSQDTRQVALETGSGSTGRTREIIFPSEGRYTVEVVMTNPDGNSKKDELNVISVERNITNLAVRLDPELGPRPYSLELVLTFLVSFETTDPSHVQLFFDFGDNTSFSLPRNTADWTLGSRCHVGFRIQHRYRHEGEYLPRVQVRSPPSDLSETILKNPVRVYHRLEAVAIEAEEDQPAGEILEFRARPVHESEYIESYHWQLRRDGENALVAGETVKSPLWKVHPLNRTGKYDLRVTVTNPLGSVSAKRVFTVLERVGGLKIRSPDKKGTVSMGETRIFRARYDSGNDVTCRWRVSPVCRSCVIVFRGCEARVTFDLAGRWSVAVEASNSIGGERTQRHILVQEKIEDLHVAVEPPDGVVYSGAAITILASVLKGSEVAVRVMFPGSDEVLAKLDSGTERFVSTQKLFRTGKDQEVIVEAFNKVSRLTRRIAVTVRRKMKTARVKPLGCVAVNVPSVFTAKTTDSKKGDLYFWKIANAPSIVSSVPYATLSFPKSGFNVVKLMVRRGAQERRARVRIFVNSSCSLSLRHDHVIEVGKKASFALEGLPPDTRVKVIYLPDPEVHRLRSNSVTGQLTWRHVFQSPAVVVVKVTAERNNISVVSAVQVQSSPTAVTLSGPRIVHIWSLPVASTWEAHVHPPETSGLVFQWSVGHSQHLISSSKKFTTSLNTSGQHTVQVIAWNHFGKVRANLTFLTVITISNLKLSAQPTPSGGASTITLNVRGEPEFNASVNFGDNASTANTTFAANKKDPTSYKSIVRHRYHEAGHYKVVANVTNSIGWLSASTIAAVEDPIVDVTLELQSPSLVALFQEVVVEAKVAKGSWPEFHWDFGDDSEGEYTNVESDQNWSVAHHSYGTAGTYIVKLVVKNAVSSVHSELSTPIKAMESIEGLHLQPFMTSVYVAALSSGDQPKTAPIQFEAHVWRGSDVEFLFDFGDGHQESVPAVVDMRSIAVAIASHIYHQEGTYHVRVTAQNPLGSLQTSLNQPFHVQFPPSNLSFSHQYYVTRNGKPVDLKVSLVHGTNVSFQWWIDGKFYKNHTDHNITLTFPHTGTYKVRVKAHNQVSVFETGPQAETRVYVQEVLTGVEMKLQLPNKTKIHEGESAILATDESILVDVVVVPHSQLALRFLWDLGIGELRRTNLPRLQYAYRNSGRYSVRVTVQNHVSEISSGNISLYLIQKIGNRTSLQHPGTSSVGQAIIFQALYSSGSDLTFEWDFGDGSALQVSTFRKSVHQYKELGEFWVILKVWNAFSSTTVKSNVFILEKPCEKPKLSLVKTSEAGIEVDFSSPVTVEVDLSTSCSLTSGIEFLWMVQPLPEGISREMLHHRDLNLPARSLPMGHYKLFLKVTMKGTIVYEMVETDLRIRPDHPSVALSGGILRTVSQNEIVHMNSTTDIGIQGVSYEWHCLGLHNHPCFPGHPTPPELYKSDITHFSFPANWLYRGGAEFQITLMQEQERYSTSQVVELHPNTSVEVECLNCKSRSVNANTRLVFRAHCSTCKDTNAEYAWKLWLIQDGHQFGSSDGYRCVRDDGSISYLLDSQEAVEMMPKLTYEVFEKVFTNNTVATVVPSTTTHDTKAGDNLATPKTIPIFTEEHSVYGSKDMDAFPEFDNPEHFHTDEEGLPGEGGSAGSRIHIFQTSERKSYFDEENKTRLHSEKRPDPRNPVRDENSVVDIVPRITSRPRVLVPLNDSQTSTGLHMQHLVIREGVLRPGSHYLLQVSVAGSTAMDYIQVLSGPEKGRCHVKPSIGTELETAFRLHCLEWKSHQLPIYYSLAYSLHPDVQTVHTVYRGLNTNAKFILPAGLHQHNYTVYLKVTVENASGATTNVCIVKCTVMPMNNLERLNITTSFQLSKLIAEQNTQAALHYIHVLATTLLQHENFCNPQLVVFLISVFEKLEYRNPITLKQALSSIIAVLRTPTKLDPEDLRALAKLVESFCHRLSQEQSLPNIGMNAVSLMIHRAVQFHLEDCVILLRRLIVSMQSAFLKQMVPNERPLAISANDLTVSFGHISHLPMRINTSHVTIILSKSTRSRRSLAKQPSIVMSEVYLYNPFPNEIKLIVQTTVCVNATITDLALDVHFKKQIVKGSPNPLFMLHQDTVNIHQLNISGHLYLSVLIRFLGKNASRDFPVQVFFGKSRNHWFQQVYSNDEMQIRIFIPPSQIPVFFSADKRQVELTLLCARNKCHREGKRWRLYKIDIWEQQCLFRQDERWTQDICDVQENVDLSVVHCRCPHLGTVGIEVQAISHHVKEVSIEEVYLLEYKSSAMVLLVLLLFTYCLFLPWCYRADIRNAHKPPIIPLEDNRTWETFNYVVTVQTGNYWDSGTTAAVFMALHGNKDLSATKCLTGQLPHHYLQRSSVDHFLFSTKVPLGELWKLQVWHNNTGANPSWYLKRVTVTDPSTGRNWKFECNQWLAVEDDDGEIEKEFLVSESSWKRFSLQSILDCICEFHLWSSVLLSPSNSPLSHSQRLTCCLITATSNAALSALAFNNFWILSIIPVDGTPWPILKVASVVSGCVFGAVLLLVLVLRWISPTTPECYLPISSLPKCLWPDLHCPLQRKETSQSSDSLHYSDSYDSPDESSYYSVEESEDGRPTVEFELEDTLSHWCEIENWARRKYEQQQHGRSLNPANALDKTALRIHKVEEINPSQCSVISYVVWTIMVTLLVLIVVLITLLTRKFDDNEVIYWLQSWFLGILCDAFLFQPLLVLFVSLLKSPKNVTVPPLTKHVSLEGQRRCDEIPYYRPPYESYLIKARCKATKIQLAFNLIMHSLTGIVVLVLLVIMICDGTTLIRYAQTAAIKNALARPRMEKMVSLSAWKQWIQHHFQETDYLHATGSILVGQTYLDTCLDDRECQSMGFRIITNNSTYVMWPQASKSNFTSVLQYLLLNPTFNLLTYVSVSVEYPYGEVTSLIKTCSPWSISTSQVRLLVEVILVFISVWMLKTEIWRFLKLGRKYVSDGWNYVQLSFCGLVLLHLFSTSYRYVLAQDLLQQYQKTGKWDPITRLRDLATWDWAIRALQGGIVFLHLCGWLKMMKLNPRTGRALAVILSSFREVIGLWVLWSLTLFGYAISINLLNGLPYMGVVSCIATGKRCLQTQDSHFISFTLRLIAAFLFFFTLGLVIATLNASRRNKHLTDNLCSLTWKEMTNLMKEQLHYRFGWPLTITKEQKRPTEAKPISASHRPLEFVLFDLDTKIDKLMQATDSLFVAKDAELPTEVVPVIFSSNEKPPPQETTSSESSICRTTLTKPNSSKAANARNRVRKTRPLRVRNSISSTSSEDIVFPRTALRKTKSRGKGKNKGLQLEVSQCSDSSVYL